MCEVSDSNGVLLLHVREEGSLVIDLEVKYSVLVGELEARCIDGGARRSSQELEGEAVEGRQH